ncbi:MAG: MerR family transcriptional regulator [Deltaproteobacteria bacterium]|nr:MerR family transcriptional regulator [Deltaproteobacteria bacterium]
MKQKKTGALKMGLDIMTVNCYIFVMEEKKYTIQDLCDLSGYTRRTIRYYVQEGLLEPPAGRGRGGFYYDSHLKRLLQIKALQDKGLKLAAIQELVKGRERPELQPSRELWVKYLIDRGIEIHITRELEEKERKKIAEIIRVARSIIESGGKGHD